jgi:hypothetical protein
MNKKDKKKRNIYLKIWRLKNQQKLLLYFRKYRAKHQIELREYQRKYRLTHKKELNLKLKMRLKNNINLRLSSQIRKRIYEVLKGNPKAETTMKLVGYSIEQLKQHLEKQFKLDMSWDNYGKWHIDHIRPCASFDLSKAEEQKKCFHYTNLQPLWAKENQIKGTNA